MGYSPSDFGIATHCHAARFRFNKKRASVSCIDSFFPHRSVDSSLPYLLLRSAYPSADSEPKGSREEQGKEGTGYGLEALPFHEIIFKMVPQ
jgi:hypothetical protein